MFPSEDFFIFVCVLESIYRSLYTEENLVMFGDNLHALIFSSIISTSYFRYQVLNFIGHNIKIDNNENISIVVYIIIKSFSRMRGKDIVRKLMAGSKKSIILHTRQNLACLSDRKMYEKKQRSVHQEIQVLSENFIIHEENMDEDYI